MTPLGSRRFAGTGGRDDMQTLLTGGQLLLDDGNRLGLGGAELSLKPDFRKIVAHGVSPVSAGVVLEGLS